jgi:hypothetical protein
MTAHAPDKPRWFALPLLALGAVGFAAAWMLVALRFERELAWLAPLAAADMVLLLAVAHWPAGRSRATTAMLATAATIALALFGIVAGQVGMGMGLRPWESALRLGADYAWELSRLALGVGDVAWLALGLVVAMVAGYRSWSGPNGARR